MKIYPALLVPRACVISALLLRFLIVDAENEENNEKKWKSSGKRKRRRRGIGGEIEEFYTRIKIES